MEEGEEEWGRGRSAVAKRSEGKVKRGEDSVGSKLEGAMLPKTGSPHVTVVNAWRCGCGWLVSRVSLHFFFCAERVGSRVGRGWNPKK